MDIAKGDVFNGGLSHYFYRVFFHGMMGQRWLAYCMAVAELDCATIRLYCRRLFRIDW